MVLTAYFALSPVTGLCCHRRLAETSAKLDASVGASGPHDFAVRKISALVFSAACVHRIPCPTSVTIAKRPSVWAGMAKDMQVSWVRREWEYFCEGDWTTQIRLILFDNSPPARRTAKPSGRRAKRRRGAKIRAARGFRKF